MPGILLTRQPKNDCEPLFVSLRTGDRLTIYGVEQLTRRLGKRAGILPCSPHMFRRGFALQSLRNGMDVYSLAALMGHEDITVLKAYLRLVEADAQHAHRLYCPVNGMMT